MRWWHLCHRVTELFSLLGFRLFSNISSFTGCQLPTWPSSKTSKTSVSRKLPSAAILLAVAARVLPFTDVRAAFVWFGSGIGGGGGEWVGRRPIELVAGLAEGQEPLVRLQWVRRLTEPQPRKDAAWDIDRLEPEGSCRIGTHCQRLGYHHRLPALEGGRGIRGEGRSEE